MTFDEEKQLLTDELGQKYIHQLLLMNGEAVVLRGEVKAVAYRSDTRITLIYSGLRKDGDDPNWYRDRRHYPWLKA